MIIFLVENGGIARSEIMNRLELRFTTEMQNEAVQDLVEKFVKLKKTKE